MKRWASKLKDSKVGWAVLVTWLGVCFFTASVFITVLLAAMTVALGAGEAQVDSITIVLFPLVIVGVSLLAAKVVSGKDDTKLKNILGLRIPNKRVWWLVPSAIFIYVTVLVVVLAILEALSPELAGQSQDVAVEVSMLTGAKLIVAVVGVGILTPIAEELFFRGLLFWGYNKNLKVIISTFMVSLVFALAHQQVNVGLDTFFFGIVLAYVRYKSDSIYPAIVMHMLKNGLALSLIIK